MVFSSYVTMFVGISLPSTCITDGNLIKILNLLIDCFFQTKSNFFHLCQFLNAILAHIKIDPNNIGL